MANLINVTPEQIQQAARTTAGYIDDWRETVQSIYVLVQELDAMWDGLANTEFNLNFEQDRPLYNRLGNLMQEYAEALIQAAQRYNDGEDDVAQIVRRK